MADSDRAECPYRQRGRVHVGYRGVAASAGLVEVAPHLHKAAVLKRREPLAQLLVHNALKGPSCTAVQAKKQPSPAHDTLHPLDARHDATLGDDFHTGEGIAVFVGLAWYFDFALEGVAYGSISG